MSLPRDPEPSPVVPHRVGGGSGSRGIARAMARKRTKCQTCNGRGKYRAAYPDRLIDPCTHCGGTGREPGL